MVYLDYAASGKVEKEVLDLYTKTVEKEYANPNTTHPLGKQAKEHLDQYTKQIASLLHILPDEIIYTSGASEANNLVMKGIADRYKNRGKHILISSLEHNSIVSCATYLNSLGFEVELIPVDRNGEVSLEALKEMIREDTILVSITSVDSELGIKQPIEQFAQFLKQYPNCIFHSDASQAIGKVDINYEDVNLVTIAPHKFNGLSSFGMLIKKKNIGLVPQILGGKSTTIYRSGTPDLAQVAALYKALEIALTKRKERYEYVEKLNEKVKQQLKTYPNVILNSTDRSIPYVLNFSLKNVRSTKLQEKLGEEEIYVSTKTSCCPVETPSKLVYALTKDKKIASTSVRVSFSHYTTEEEIAFFLKTFAKIEKELEENGEV